MTIGRDRLRELLDAVLDEGNTDLGSMARSAFSSPWHFGRTFAAGTGESPVALRRRVMLERAAWELCNGATVTSVAFTAGYESVEGFGRAFARAYGCPPSAAHGVLGTGANAHWLPAPNGIHFHPPVNLWIDNGEGRAAADPGAEVVARMVQHDLADTAVLFERAADLDTDEYTRIRFPGLVVLAWDGPEESVAAVLAAHVRAKEVWLAAMTGTDLPSPVDHDRTRLRERFDAVGPRWADAVRDIHRRGAWNDRLIDALCDPPESFVLGGVIAHVLTFSAHRRLLVRHMLRAAGLDVDDGDPLAWGHGLSHDTSTTPQERIAR